MRTRSLLKVVSRRSTVIALIAMVALGLAIPTGIGLGATPPKKAAPAQVTDYLAYTGGKKGKATGSPIAIGWINAEGGTQSFPADTRAAQAAVDYVNNALGGVGGHPLVLHSCFIKSAEEEGQTCGQQMANDSAVKVVAVGLMVVGNEAFYGVLRGAKPVVMGVSASPVDGSQKNVFALNGDQPHVLGPWGTFTKNYLHGKSVAIVYPSQAGANSAADATKKGLQDAKLGVTSVGYDPTATDLVGPLTAAGAQNADVLVPMTDFAGCGNFAKAQVSLGLLGKPVVANPLCTFLPPASYPGGDFPKWYVGFAQANVAVNSPDVAAYKKYAGKYGLSAADQLNVFAALGWADVMAITRLMNQIGASKVTSKSLSKALAAFTGPVPMGPAVIKCGQFKDAPAICNNTTQFYKYTGGGAWQRITGWLAPPK